MVEAGAEVVEEGEGLEVYFVKISLRHIPISAHIAVVLIFMRQWRGECSGY